VDVVNLLNESGNFVDCRLIRRRVCLCGGMRKCNINGSQGLESQNHMKWAMAGGTMEIPVVTVLFIWKTLVPCTWMLRILHAQDVQNHPIDDLCSAISLGVEISAFGDLGVQQRSKNRPKGAKEPVVSFRDDGLWYLKVDPHWFEEELGSTYQYDILFIGCEDGHLRKLINDNKYTFISFLGGW
jgi:hypothetical protein